MHNMCDKHKHMLALVNNAGCASGTDRSMSATSFHFTQFNGDSSLLSIFFPRSLLVCKYPHIFRYFIIRYYGKQCTDGVGRKQRGDKKLRFDFNQPLRFIECHMTVRSKIFGLSCREDVAKHHARTHSNNQAVHTVCRICDKRQLNNVKCMCFDSNISMWKGYRNEFDFPLP